MTSADSLRQVLLRSSHSVRKASQGKGTIFLVIYPPHLHREFRIAWGFSLCCNLTHSHMPDAVPVRRTNGLPRASFRFHLTMDTLAFGYALGAIPCARDFHPLDCTHAWHTATRPAITQVFAGLVILSADSEISRRRASTPRRSGGSIRGPDIQASERFRSRSRGWSAADHGRAARAEPCRRPWKSSRSRASCR